jgi:hypothetical protein
MKKLLFILFFISAASYSQTYKSGAGFFNPNFFKMDATLKISDVKVSIENSINNKTTVIEYEVVKKVNGYIYITDGVMTHSLSMLNETGTKKGFKYDTLIVFSFDKRQSEIPLMYYSKLQD